MYYLVYLITNTINGKRYIGVHKTLNVDDSYMGSGRYLKNAQKRYGIENFVKTILAVFDNPDDMFNVESTLVNEEFVNRDDTYNISTGGRQPLDYANESGKNIYTNHAAISKRNLDYGRLVLREKFKDPKFIKRFKANVSVGVKKHLDTNGSHWKGRHHTDETKRKIGDINSVKQKGSCNSQF